MRPLICTRPPPISSRMTGAVMTSALPFSTSTIAIRLPTFSRVTSLKMRAPVPSRLTCTAGSLVRWSKPGCASLMRSPVSTTCRLTSTGWPSRSVKRSLPNGTLPAQRRLERAGFVVDHADFERRGAAEDVLGARRVLHAGQLHDDAVGALLLDDRLGDAELVDAVAQDLDVLLDRAVLDALLRLGLQARDEPQVAAGAALGVAQREVGIVLLDLVRALVRSASSLKRITTLPPSRAMPPYWTFSLRSSERMSVV